MILKNPFRPRAMLRVWIQSFRCSSIFMPATTLLSCLRLFFVAADLSGLESDKDMLGINHWRGDVENVQLRPAHEKLKGDITRYLLRKKKTPQVSRIFSKSHIWSFKSPDPQATMLLRIPSAITSNIKRKCTSYGIQPSMNKKPIFQAKVVDIPLRRIPPLTTLPPPILLDDRKLITVVAVKRAQVNQMKAVAAWASRQRFSGSLEPFVISFSRV